MIGYFWKDGRIVELADSLYHSRVAAADLAQCYCVDTAHTHPDARYGVFLRHTGWKHREFSSFPPAFRAQLLLLGVT
jgi:hypothetical protein